MSKTVVGLFNTTAKAEQVRQTLLDDGYESQHVKVVANNDTGDATTGTGEGIGDKISGFFKSLIGGDEVVHSHYATGVNEGGALLAVTVDDEEASEVAATLKEHGARDIDGGYREAASAGTPVYGSGIAADRDTVIPIVEEELVVGKREVDRGGVRIYSHLTETPAEADVTLREERINVERRAVNRPATAADFEAGKGGAVELYATGEEAVVGKTSRVVEEVSVGKSSSERTEAVRDTVRKTEVEVENLQGETTKSKW